jgi:hypothetical protein
MNYALIASLCFIISGGGEVETYNLEFERVKEWQINLPNESWTKIGNSIPIGKGFLVQSIREGGKLGPDATLSIDTNADGSIDANFKHLELRNDVRGNGIALLRGKREDGSEFSYSIRLTYSNKLDMWYFSCAGLMSAKINGVKVSLIDQNNNGIWNEIGTDAIIVGKGNSASYLSEVVNLDGELFTLNASKNGDVVSVTPYEGESGVLNVVEGYVSKGKLTSAVFTSTDSKFSFELSEFKKGMKVPAGAYELTHASVKKGTSEGVTVTQGLMKAISIESEQNVKLAWGGPLRIDFETSRASSEIIKRPAGMPPITAAIARSAKCEGTTVVGNSLKFYGSAEEEYQFFPLVGLSRQNFLLTTGYVINQSPKITARDKKSGNKVLSSKLCRGCEVHNW